MNTAGWLAAGAATCWASTLVAARLWQRSRTTHFGRERSARRADRFHLLVMGDSVPSGVGSGGRTYGRTLAGWAGEATGRPASVLNLALPGLTVHTLLGQLTIPRVRRAVRLADAVIITVGANDLSARALTSRDADPARLDAAIARMTRGLTSALTRITDLRGGAGGVLLTGYWNVFADGEVGARKGIRYVHASDVVTRRTNAALRVAAESVGVRFVDLYAPFKGVWGLADPTRLLAGDGEHPNAAGHRVIAEALFEPLRGQAQMA